MPKVVDGTVTLPFVIFSGWPQSTTAQEENVDTLHVQLFAHDLQLFTQLPACYHVLDCSVLAWLWVDRRVDSLSQVGSLLVQLPPASHFLTFAPLRV